MKIEKIVTMPILLILISGCAVNTKNSNAVPSKPYTISIAQDDRYSLIGRHVECYICETNQYPTVVADLESYEPETYRCKKVFKKSKFDSTIKHFSEYKFYFQEYENSLGFTANKYGLPLRELGDDEHYVSGGIGKKCLLSQ